MPQKKKTKANQELPNIPTYLWWDWDYEKMNFCKAHVLIIERVIEYGNNEIYAELIRFYGIDLIINDLKFEIWFLTDHAIEKASNYFSIKKEEMKCYIYKQSHKTYWL